MLSYIHQLFEPKSNAVEITQLLLHLLEVNITTTTLKKDISEHPDYPGIISISDILHSFGVDNLSARFSADKLIQVPVPFITLIKGQQHDMDFYTVVKTITADSFVFFDPEKRVWATLSHAAFSARCSGIVLMAEPKPSAGERDYIKNQQQEKRHSLFSLLALFSIPAIVVLAGLLAFFQTGAAVLLPFLLLVEMLAGSLIAGLLIWYELDLHNPLLQQICSAGKKVNCSAILHSKASKIAGVSWSVIGFTYFTGGLFFLLTGGFFSPTTLSVITWINTLAVPYVFFSLYYQYSIARQWCVLCLCVQGILVLQFLTVLTGGWHHISLPTATSSVIPLLLSYLLPSLTASLFLPVFRNAKNNQRKGTELQRLKHNAMIFESLLVKQKHLTHTADGLGIILGNPKAANKIIKVCNPYCGPCSRAHTPLEELLHHNEDLQIQIIFSVAAQEDHARLLPVKHLLAIAEQGNPQLLMQALDDWYLAAQKDYDAFAVRHPITTAALSAQQTRVQEMRNWCQQVGVSFTPTFFLSPATINGGVADFHQLPEIYTVNDLKYFFYS
ncbi:vitamin K epoxide reductase family protein [Chitinophaga nivalis]|uniref:Cysteine peptidase family C39 domain-containing protein n=1 Tax=Chitinophaga nivalis TaxID=2991709 RepID=A0ABT3IKZ0_9BACT|nr:vitamin K epoxide reductase family protein [Chitinophaga nivalis]MCW3465875.1 cysteine peptidase family C39 domain-containing protein [Chitinophaga nivalis]MCW3484434.1 cysteine peptidase family C39 domain-containing protein [Chitinophaga nivalis]